MTVTAEQRLEFRQNDHVVSGSGLPSSTLDAVIDEHTPFWGPTHANP
jgi:hypothetical protein